MKGKSRRNKGEVGPGEVFIESERTKQISLVEMFREVAELFKVQTDLSGQAFIYMADALENRKKSNEQKLFAPTTRETTIALFEKAGNEFKNVKPPALKLVSEVWLKAAELLRQKISIKNDEKVELDAYVVYELERNFLTIVEELSLKLSVLLTSNEGVLRDQGDKGEIVRLILNTEMSYDCGLVDENFLILKSYLQQFCQTRVWDDLVVRVGTNDGKSKFDFVVPRSKISEVVSLDLARACMASILTVV